MKNTSNLAISTAYILTLMLSPNSFAAHPVGSVNEFLGNSARTEVIGPEMWTSTIAGIKPPGPDGAADLAFNAQMPYYGWDAPKFGMSGQWHLCHGTPLFNVVDVRISRVDDDKTTKLEFTPSRNWWTPASMTTYYRSRPSGRSDEYPNAGPLAVKERKCITTDNVFVAEMSLNQDSKVSQEYVVEVVTRFPTRKGIKPPHILFTTVDTQGKAGGLGKYNPIPVKGFGVTMTTMPSLTHRIKLKPYGRFEFRYSFRFDSEHHKTAAILAHDALARDDVFDRNAEEFDQWFERNVPALHVTNQKLLKAYYYRYYVVYRGYHNPRRLLPEHPYPRPVFYESPTGGWYGCVIGLPLPCQIQETRWLKDGMPGWDHIQNWSEGVQGYRGYIQFTPMAIWEFAKSHPDNDLLAKVYESARAFAYSYLPDGDPRKLPMTTGSWVTGAEYQPNFYQFTEPPWDFRNDSEFEGKPGNEQFKRTNLIRLDKAAHAIANLRGCAQMARVLGHDEAADKLKRDSGTLLSVLKDRHWDEKTGMFYAADPKTYALADQAPCYDSFAPFMWSTISEARYLQAFDKFLDPDWFWSEFPLRTTSQTCPMYWSGNAQVGPAVSSLGEPHYYGCSWNGPTWHYANGLMAEAFGAAARTDSKLRPKWIDFMDKWTELHFLYGERAVPCAREHHRPTDGARFAGTNDYFHSAWIDPFIRYYLGVNISDDLKTVTFDPYTEKAFRIEGVPVLGRASTFVQQTDSKGEPVRSILSQDGKVLLSQTGTKPLVLTVK
jgi:hypothetical protein